MDIILDADGDMYVSPDGDITLANSVAQKIRIKLLWFESEWKWDQDEGMPWFNEIMVKNPDIDYIESIVREKIFEVDEVTEVKEVEVTYDSKTRCAVLSYVALTDFETIKEEVSINV